MTKKQKTKAFNLKAGPKISPRSAGANDRFEGVQLGDLAKDAITGFEGAVTSLRSNISGCDQVHLQPFCVDGRAIG